MISILYNAVIEITAIASATVDGLISLTNSIFIFNFIVMRAVCNVCVATINYSCDLIINIIYAFHYSIRDFGSFICDIGDLVLFFISLINSGVSQLTSAAARIASSLLYLYVCIKQNFQTTYSVIGHTINIIIWNLYYLTCLVGRSVKLTISLIPATFVKVFQVIISSVDLLKTLLVSCYEWILSTVIHLFYTVSNQSVDVYLGCAVGALFIYIFRNPAIIQPFYVRLKDSFRILYRNLKSASLLLISNVLLVIPSRRGPLLENRPVVPEHHLDNDESEELPLPPRTPQPTPNRIPNGCPNTVERRISELNRELERLRESQMCVICQDAIKCIILIPCKHLCLCRTCYRRMLYHQIRCPICRSIVEDYLQVYS